MDPMTFMALSQAIPATFQMVKGIKDNRRADALERNLKPLVYDIPGSRTESLQMARNRLGSRNFSGQQYAEMDVNNQVANATSDVIRASTSGADAIAGLTGLQDSAMDSRRKIRQVAAQDYDNKLATLRDELSLMAMEEKTKWDIEKQQPHLRKLAEISAYRFSGDQNAYQGIKGLSNAAGGYAGYAGMQAGSNTGSLPAAVPTPNTGGGGVPPTMTPEQMYYWQQIMGGGSGQPMGMNPNFNSSL